MNRRTRPARNIRITLVIAALLHVLGGDFGAWLHVRFASATETVAPGGGRDKSPIPTHSPDCAVCQTLGGGTPELPPVGALFRAHVASFAPVVAAAALAPRSRPVPPSLPRGPPHLS